MWRVLKKKSKKVKKNIFRKKVFNIFLGCTMACSLIIYLVQVNGLATKGYQIKELEQKIDELKKSSRELEGKSLELQSLSAISGKLKDLNMVESKEALYIHENSRTALKK